MVWTMAGRLVMPQGGPRPARRKVKLSRPEQCRELDGRTLEGKTERRVIRELTAHVGTPTFPQKVLIRRAARLVTVIEVMEQKLVENDEVSDWASRQFLAWVNTLRQILVALGVQRTQPAPTSLKSYVGGKAA
jgi:hypothetical protein